MIKFVHICICLGNGVVERNRQKFGSSRLLGEHTFPKYSHKKVKQDINSAKLEVGSNFIMGVPERKDKNYNSFGYIFS